MRYLQERERGEEDIVDVNMERSYVVVNETKLKVGLRRCPPLLVSKYAHQLLRPFPCMCRTAYLSSLCQIKVGNRCAHADQLHQVQVPVAHQSDVTSITRWILNAGI